MCKILNQSQTFPFNIESFNPSIQSYFNPQLSLPDIQDNLSILLNYNDSHESNSKQSLYTHYNSFNLIQNSQEFHNYNYEINQKDRNVIQTSIQIKSQQIIHQNQTKNQKKKQRSIRQVARYIQKWRKLHNSIGVNGKMNLQQAAIFVGIPKKSLDDYYCQLRLGQKYGFDFKSNLDEKIGVLRTFVKKNRQKNQKNHKNQKHPKFLKFLSQIDSLPMKQIKREREICYESNDFMEEIKMENKLEDVDLTPMQQFQHKQLENQFYQSFDLLRGQMIDPFVEYRASEYRIFGRQQRGKEDYMIQYNEFF